MLRPIDLYNAYPDRDLLPFEAPTEDENWEDFSERIGEISIGDTLFVFLVDELQDACTDHLELILRVRTAIEDLQAVERMLFSRWRDKYGDG